MKIFLLCVSIALASCGNLDCRDPKNGSNARCAIENAVVDCTTKTAKDFVSQHLGDLSIYFKADGIDWTAISSALENLVLPEGICVLETAWSNHFAKVALAPLPAPGESPPMKLRDVSADRAMKDKISAKRWPGKSAKLY